MLVFDLVIALLSAPEELTLLTITSVQTAEININFLFAVSFAEHLEAVRKSQFESHYLSYLYGFFILISDPSFLSPDSFAFLFYFSLFL